MLKKTMFNKEYLNKNILKKWWLPVAGILIVFCIASGIFYSVQRNKTLSKGDGAKDVQYGANGKITYNKVSVNKEHTEDKLYDINEEAKDKDITVMVTSVEKSNGDDTIRPKSGMEFVVVHVTLKNIGKKAVATSPLDFRMKNSSGKTVDINGSIILDRNTQLIAKDLPVGEEIIGTVVFEQPKDDKNLILTYENLKINNNKIIKFKLNNENK